MTELPEGVTLKDLEKYVALDTSIKKATLLKNALNTKIKDAFTKKGTFVYDQLVIKLALQNRTDNNAIALAYPFEQFPQYYAPALDPKKVPDKIKSQFAKEVETLSISVTSE